MRTKQHGEGFVGRIEAETVVSGVIAGAIMIGVESMASLVTGRHVLLPFRYAASIVMGSDALEGSWLSVFILGTIVHFSIATMFAFAYGVMNTQLPGRERAWARARPCWACSSRPSCGCSTFSSLPAFSTLGCSTIRSRCNGGFTPSDSAFRWGSSLPLARRRPTTWCDRQVARMSDGEAAERADKSQMSARPASAATWAMSASGSTGFATWRWNPDSMAWRASSARE